MNSNLALINKEYWNVLDLCFQVAFWKLRSNITVKQIEVWYYYDAVSKCSLFFFLYSLLLLPSYSIAQVIFATHHTGQLEDFWSKDEHKT